MVDIELLILAITLLGTSLIGIYVSLLIRKKPAYYEELTLKRIASLTNNPNTSMITKTYLQIYTPARIKSMLRYGPIIFMLFNGLLALVSLVAIIGSFL